MIEINNLTNFSVDKKLFLGVAKKVLKGENKETEDLSIAFVSPLEIQKINKQYRGKNKPTDVLSFENPLDFKGGSREVVICPEVVKEKAEQNGTSLKEQLTWTLVHGILHTLGHDHEKSEKEASVMEQKEKYYLDKA